MKQLFGRRVWRALCVCLGLLLSLQARADIGYQLPSMGDSRSAALSPAEAEKIGNEAFRRIRQVGYLFDDDDQINAYIRHLGRNIAQHTERPAKDFHFFVVRDKQINAFAIPGGYIGVNYGLILATRNENELAGVLAHEIAHITQHHMARQMQASTRFNIATVAALVVAVLAGASNPDVVQAALTMGLGIAGQQRINFTRAHEQEADRVGIRIMAAAGYDPHGMANFFSYMEQRSQIYGDQVPQILLSHPVSSSRVAEARERIAELKIPPPHNQADYRLIRARLRVLTAALNADARTYFADSKTLTEPARSYGLSLVEYRTSHYQKALQLQQQLMAAHPGNVHIAMALASTLAATSKLEQALDTLADASHQHPDYLPLTLLRAHLYTLAGDAGQARSLLQQPDVLDAGVPDVYKLLAQAALKQQQLPEAHYRMGQYHLQIGEFDRAMDQVKAGLRIPKLKAANKARLEILQKRIDEAWPEAERRRYEEQRSY